MDSGTNLRGISCHQALLLIAYQHHRTQNAELDLHRLRQRVLVIAELWEQAVETEVVDVKLFEASTGETIDSESEGRCADPWPVSFASFQSSTYQAVPASSMNGVILG